MQVVDSNGFLKVRLSGVSDGITIGTTLITSGTVGRILFEGTGNVVQESANLFWDNTNGRLGIGGTPSETLDVKGNATSGFNAISFKSQYTSVGYLGGDNTSIFFSTAPSSGGSYLSLSGSNANLNGVQNIRFLTGSTERARIASTTGNVLINTTTDAGFRLDVNGTARVINTLQVGGGATAGRIELSRAGTSNAGYIYMSSNNMVIENASQGLLFNAIGAERMRIAPTTANLLINTTTDAGFKLDVNGTARVSGPSTYSMVYDSNGILNLNGTYARLDLFNQSGSLRARLNCDGPNGTLTLYQNAAGYIFLNGAQSGNNSYISTALSIGNQSAANASSILEVSSTTKGFLPPRMTTTQKNAIATPAAGLMVYDTTLNLISYYNGTSWI